MTVNKLLISISKAFAGEYKNTNPDISKMKGEMFSTKVPDASVDRENLRRDTKAVCDDLRVALEEKKAATL